MKNTIAVFILATATHVLAQEIQTASLASDPFMHFAGTVNNKYKVQMNLTITKTGASGNYRYLSQSSGLHVSGDYNPMDGKLNLEEKVSQDKVTGYFEGVLKGNTYSGTWFSADRKKSFPFSISTPEHDSAVDLIASFTKDGDFINLKELQIKNRETGKIVQTISTVETYLHGDKPMADLEDLNFDGYPDLTIVIDNYPANTPCSYWLYDSSKASFIECKECSDKLFSPTVDLANKQLHVYTRDGCCWHVEEHYVFQDGRYFKVWQEIDDKGTKSITKFVVKDGKSVEVK